MLVAAYGVFALAAVSRSVVQITTRFEIAPLAYLLSAFAGVVYLVAAVALGEGIPRARAVAWAACSIELVGVVSVGTLSVVRPGTFPDATVWSDFGIGYGFVPAVLPLLGLAWLWHTGVLPEHADWRR